MDLFLYKTTENPPGDAVETFHWGWGDAQLTLAPPCAHPGGAGGTGMQLGMGTGDGGEALCCLSCLQQGIFQHTDPS